MALLPRLKAKHYIAMQVRMCSCDRLDCTQHNGRMGIMSTSVVHAIDACIIQSTFLCERQCIDIASKQKSISLLRRLGLNLTDDPSQ